MTYDELEQLNLPNNARILVHTDTTFQYEASRRWTKIYKDFKDKKISFEVIIMHYVYGIKLRGFSLGCQPMQGFVERKDDPNGKYYDLLIYNRRLSDKELSDYELEFCGVKEENNKNYVVAEYNKLQEIFSNAVIIYRLNDFYEIIGDKASEVAGICNLTTAIGRNCGDKEYTPFLKYPVSFAEKYHKKLSEYYELIIVNSYNDMHRIAKGALNNENK